MKRFKVGDKVILHNIFKYPEWNGLTATLIQVDPNDNDGFECSFIEPKWKMTTKWWIEKSSFKSTNSLKIRERLGVK